MARTGKLSAVEVAKAKGPAVLHDGGGLYLRVAPTGAKSWVFRFQIEGKRRDMGLGPYPDVTLARAREKAAAHRAQSREGADPLAAKRAERQAQRLADAKGRTFREVAEEYIARNEAGWRNAKHRQQWRNTLATYVYPADWAICRSRRSMPGLSCKCLIRSGRQSRKRRAGCAGVSRRCSMPRPCAATARDRTRRNGRAISRISCRHARRCGGSSTMRRCRSTNCPSFSPLSASGPAWRHGRWNS